MRAGISHFMFAALHVADVESYVDSDCFFAPLKSERIQAL